MAKSKNDGGTPATTATSATPAAHELEWRKTKVAEDELSVLWRQTARIASSEQAEEAARQTQVDHFWPQIEALADFCDEVLVEHSFPKAAQYVRHDGEGNWWELSPDHPKRPPTGEIWKFTLGKALAQEFSDDFSDPWYAGRIGFECRLALEHFHKGDAGKPFLFTKIFEIATLRADWKWRRGHKPSILTGRSVRKGAKAGGDMRRNKCSDATLGILQEMERLITDGKSISRAAELAASNGLGTSKDANRKLWGRHRAE